MKLPGGRRGTRRSRPLSFAIYFEPTAYSL